LREGFSKWGHIVHCNIARKPDGASRGFGFVRFEDPRDAQDALDNMNNKEFEGRTIKIQLAIERPRHTDGKEWCFVSRLKLSVALLPFSAVPLELTFDRTRYSRQQCAW
jgi:RNA recognition motif-containing protein